MKVLVLNAGSSSVKYQLYEMPDRRVLAKGLVERIGEDEASISQTAQGRDYSNKTAIKDHQQAMELIASALVSGDAKVLGDISEVAAVGHRVVHGGEEFTGSVVVDDKVIASIEKFADLAPLHNPPNLTGVRAAQAKMPNAVQVVCFDTAFHTSIPKTAYMYALPYEFYEKYRIRRYGFHGTSHRYVSEKTAEVLGRDLNKVNVITCHLGNGCSLAAVKNGKCIDTSMGLTPLEGVVMGTRCGDIDPAIIFYLVDKGYDPNEIKQICNKKSGLLGISGQSNDMRNLQELAGQGDRRAGLAIDIFCYRIKKYIGAYCAALGSVDAVVFTGGIGENDFKVRQNICSGLGQVGIVLDEQKNDGMRGEQADLSDAESKVKVLVIPTDEEAVIAGDTYNLAVKE